MTVHDRGRGESAPLSRRRLRELERRRALEEAGQDPDAPDAAWPAAAADPAVDGGTTGSGGTELGYEEFTRELGRDRSLTRRELRALYEARQAERRTAQGSPAEPTSPGTDDAVDGDRVEAEHEAVLMEPVADDLSAAEPVAESARAGTQNETEGETVRAETETVRAEAIQTTTADAELLEPAGTSGHVEHPGDDGVDDAADPAHVVIPFRAVAGQAEPAGPESAPAPHWSTGAEPVISTSSIVLPASPGAAPRPLDSTGEVIVTGIIDLPRDLATTGGHPAGFDSPEIDRLLDAADGDGEFESAAAPVSASRTVGSGTSSASVVGSPRSRVSLPVVLAGTGGVMMVGVGALLVVAFSLR